MRFYRALLHLYPRSFRNEYGDDMAAIFAARTTGAGPVAPLLWLSAIADVVVNAARVHLDILRQDLRFTRRTLAASKGFAATAVIVTALGIGATTAAFSITDLVLIRKPGFADVDRLVRIWERQPQYARLEPSPSNYRDWKAQAGSFDAMGAYTGRPANVAARRESVRLEGVAMTSDVFAMLGARAALGRLLSPDDDRKGAPPAIVLGHAAWRDTFGGDPAVVGTSVRVDGQPHTIIGVMREGFTFPARDTAMWTSLQLGPEDFEDIDNNYLQVLARLKPGIGLDEARAEMSAIAERLERAHPKENAQTGATLQMLGDQVPTQTRLLLFGLFGASLCVLLIACTNLASLLVARAIGRRGELAIRAALGAGRERLVRQLLTESLTVSLAGGALGLFIAYSAVPVLRRLVPVTLPLGDASILDPRVLAFTFALTVTTAIAFGVVPAWRACRAEDVSDLRTGMRSATVRRGQRARAALVIGQVTAAVALLIGAGLLIRALSTVQSISPGFRTADVLAVQTPLDWPKYAPTARRADFYTRVLDQTRALPGVAHAAFISFVPMTMTGGIWEVEMPGVASNPSAQDSTTASLRFVTPGFFDTLAIPLVRGRDVREADTASSPFVAVVSESFVRRYWPDQDPLGRQFKVAMFDRTVVGVVRDVRVRGLERESEPQVYVPYRQIPDGWMTFYAPRELVVQASTDPTSLVASIRRIVKDVDPDLPVARVRTLAEIVDAQTAPRQTQLRVLQAFAGLSLLLAAVGIHGLLAYTVSQRRAEIGLRMALGARAADILTLVLRQSVSLAVPGTVLGLLIAYAAARQMEALLAGIPPADPTTFLLAGGLALLMTLAGSLLPATRAINVDAASVMRSD